MPNVLPPSHGLASGHAEACDAPEMMHPGWGHPLAQSGFAQPMFPQHPFAHPFAQLSIAQPSVTQPSIVQPSVAQHPFSQHPFAQPAFAQPTAVEDSLERLESLLDQVPGMNKVQVRALSSQLSVTQHGLRLDDVKTALAAKLGELVL